MLTYSHLNNRYEKTFKPMEAEDFKAFALRVLKQWRKTGETAAEYRRMAPAEQLHTKDTGGFVAGTFRDTKRGKNNVERRFALTLDIDGDKPNMNQLQTLRLIYPCALFWYTTHKSTPEVPRYRIVCELSRPVTAAEYTQLSRNLCASLRLEVDPSTHQADRLMFYPSTSSDGDMRGRYEEGAPLDVDQLLALAPPEAILPQELADDKQADPRTKPGAVGAFCRVFSIDRAIRELVPGFYIPAGEGRYTYKDSTTAGGAVAMEGDAFLYSFHGSDPNANKLLNAFDLVRLLKFGSLDEGIKKTGAALPSYKAMEEYALNLSEVAEELHRAAVAELPDDGEWVKELEIRKSGDLKGSIANYELILRNDPKLAGAVKLNEFAHRLEVVRPLPWRADGRGGEWTDADDAGLRGYTERNYKEVNRGNLSDALVNVYEENRYHPVREYLDGLKWDGVKRLDTLLVDYMGAEDCAYTRAVTRKALTAAVARIYRPGVKFDYVLTLVGREGVGKSSLFARLGGAWFSDTFLSVSGKEAVEQLQGVWIMEIGELAGLKKAEVEAIKAYISSREDRVRLAYAKRTATFPRECVFVATTNNPSFLRSANGNRRFWPVEVGKAGTQLSLWDDLDEKTVGQIWAEAKAAYRAREPLFLKGAEAETAQAKQAAHQEADEWESLIAEYLDRSVPKNWRSMSLPRLAARFLNGAEEDGDPFAPQEAVERREAVCARQIWNECFGRPVHELDAQKVRRINAILNDMPGWERCDTPKKFGPYGLNRCYERKNGND